MLTDISEVRAASIIRAMEAARTSETSVDIQLRARQYIPEDSELQCSLLSHWDNFVLYNETPAYVSLRANVYAH
jgi:hypothetical protein